MAELTSTAVLAKTKVDNLAAVKNLNAWGGEFEDVSIVRQLPNLEVLALSVNKINGLGDFAYCSNLKELYLRKNNVSSLAEVKHLGKLPKLTVLWLCDNPCAVHPLYRTFVVRCCPALKQLDNVEVTAQERADAANMAPKEIDEILAGKGKHAPRQEPPLPPPVPAAAAAPSAQGRSDKPTSREAGGSGRDRGPQLAAASPTPAGGAAPAPSGSGHHHSSRQTQKNVLSATLTLLNEMNVDTLQFLHQHVGELLEKKRAGL
eukprot:CAMPEP_0174832198 /NCGR_PEP_ID=MMETSP1114-20130205/3545_1 /TAXON_ID=312471 /ORGANISM="Neobodo designis, Strain CCAP 1951/1" /LENGTH=260 /DNA_ID=CAMNT_0016066053 /DNA_START=69 /DNA_END=851 /DNA_ORIENTATION=-